MVYTRTEDYIKDLLYRCRIYDYTDLNIEKISTFLKIPVRYWEFNSESVCLENKYIIFINAYATIEVQWQDFAHELGHVLWHAGRQENIPQPFRQLQEWQAENFSYHLCIPTFMLEKINNVNVRKISYLFNVEYNFAVKRLEIYKRKLISFNYSLKHSLVKA